MVCGRDVIIALETCSVENDLAVGKQQVLGWTGDLPGDCLDEDLLFGGEKKWRWPLGLTLRPYDIAYRARLNLT